MSMEDFQLLSKIGEGNGSKVYKVRRIVDDQIYAMKRVRLDKMTTEDIDNAVNEVRLLASLRHPNVVAYKQAFFDPYARVLCIVMEYADKGDLLQTIFTHKKNGRVLAEDFIWNVLVQVLQGLSALHDLRITHGDLKSANVFLTHNSTVKLGDLNVATVLPKGMKTDKQAGTPYYASPQVWKGQPHNCKSDMWSLGIILYELIHLKPPFRARDEEGLAIKVQRGYFGKVSRDYSQDFAQVLSMLINPDHLSRPTPRQLLRHPILKSHTKNTRQMKSLETSTLLKTIKPSKNFNYLTEKLPKPNYVPVRYKSLREGEHSMRQGHSMALNRSEVILRTNNKSLGKSQKLTPSNHQMRSSLNPEWLPQIRAKWQPHF